MRDEKLTSFDYRLYDYLKERGDEWTFQEKIATDLGLPVTLPFHDCATRQDITRSIRRLNNSNVIQKLILSTCKGIKIANMEEADKYIERRRTQILARLQVINKMSKKAGRDGQWRIVFNKESPMIKSFLDSDKKFGEKMKELRLKNGMSQAQVEKQIWERHGVRIDCPTISRFECGVSFPTKTQLAIFSEIYGYDFKKYLGG